jgi:hypothetical protein
MQSTEIDNRNAEINVKSSQPSRSYLFPPTHLCPPLLSEKLTSFALVNSSSSSRVSPLVGYQCPSQSLVPLLLNLILYIEMRKHTIDLSVSLANRASQKNARNLVAVMVEVC